MSLYSSLRQVLAPYAAKLNGLLTGWDGTEYNTPGEAVRSQISALHVLIGDEPGTAINASAVGYEDGSVADAIAGLNGRLNHYEDVFTGDVDESVKNWLDEHPEATTTVADRSLTEAKFSDALKLKAIKDYVTPEMFGAVGDGVTNDLNAFKSLNGRMVVLKRNTVYYIETQLNVLFTSDTIIIGNGATIKVLFKGTHYPSLFKNANFIVKNCNFDVSIASETTRTRVFDTTNHSVYLENVYAVINKVPGAEKISFAECNNLRVINCTIINNSECASDGGTLWAKGENSELIIKDSYISGKHHDEVIANYGGGLLRTLIDNCTIVTSSKITVRSLSDTAAISKAKINNCDITFTDFIEGNKAFDIGGESTNYINMSFCTLHGAVSYVFSSSTYRDNDIHCYVKNCNVDDMTYTWFIDASLALLFYMQNTDVNYLMRNPTEFRIKRVALDNCKVEETFLINARADDTAETLSMDLWLNNCVIATAHYDSKTRTALNPHLMINSFIGGNHVDKYI